MKHPENQIEEKIKLFGRKTSYLILPMVLITFAIVILRYVFQVGWVWMQEIVIYLHGFVLLMVSAATLAKNEHVRVDMFYQKMTEQRKNLVNLLGSALFLVPRTLKEESPGFKGD